MEQITTIGYEKADLKDFIATLKAARVSTLIDIRERAISRRKGFSKNALCQALKEAGIRYHHEPILGSRSEMREQLKKDWNYDVFFKAFDQYLSSCDSTLRELAEQFGGVVSLLCYERDYTTCHRMSVARELAQITDASIRHLGVKDGISNSQGATASAHSSQGLPAT